MASPDRPAVMDESPYTFSSAQSHFTVTVPDIAAPWIVQ
jgi:hypothetical protein